MSRNAVRSAASKLCGSAPARSAPIADAAKLCCSRLSSVSSNASSPRIATAICAAGALNGGVGGKARAQDAIFGRRQRLRQQPVEHARPQPLAAQLRPPFQKPLQPARERDDGAGAAGQLAIVVVDHAHPAQPPIGERGRQVELEAARDASRRSLADMREVLRPRLRDLIAVDERPHPARRARRPGDPALNAQAADPSRLTAQPVGGFGWGLRELDGRADGLAGVGEPDFGNVGFFRVVERQHVSITAIAVAERGQLRIEMMRACDGDGMAVEPKLDHVAPLRRGGVEHMSSDLVRGGQARRGLQGRCGREALRRRNIHLQLRRSSWIQATICAAALSSQILGSSERSPHSTGKAPNDQSKKALGAPSCAAAASSSP